MNEDRQPFTAACPSCGQDARCLAHRDGAQGSVPDIDCPTCDGPAAALTRAVWRRF